jgi:hypothetical protein
MRSSIDASDGTFRAGTSLLGVMAAVLGVGCTSALPVRQVVIYRNGVAYFERGGYVSRTDVRFKMKESEVSDFLATLAVREPAGAGDAASFPVRAVDVEAQSDGTGQSNALETVVLTLDGHPHDLHVGYVGQAPVWKPSYRLIIHPGGTANLQLWGIVQNLSGEDWKMVKLSLVAGAPIAFQSDLRTPVTPWRPTVTDRGDPTPPMVPGEASYGYRSMSRAMSDESSGQVTAAETTSRVDPRLAAHRREVAQITGAASVPPNASTGVGVSVERGTTRYDVPQPVTIPFESASMVMVLDRKVTGDELLLFAPDPDVPASATHPFRAARFVNDTGGALEAGPITLFEDGSFLSQALIGPLPPGASGTMPLGIDDSVVVTHSDAAEERSGSLANDGVGGLTVTRERVTRSTYQVRNDSAQPVKVLVKHPHLQGSRLIAPQGTEESVGLASSLVPATVAAHASADLVVEERVPSRDAVDWFAPAADAAVHAYLTDPHADPVVAKKLTDVWSFRNEVVKLIDERNSERVQQYDWTLKTGRPEAAAKVAAFDRKLVELDAKIATMTAHFNVILHDIVAPAGL